MYDAGGEVWCCIHSHDRWTFGPNFLNSEWLENFILRSVEREARTLQTGRAGGNVNRSA